MQLSASLNLKQKQSLVMTPQLQQAIRLLQMTNLDLRQYLETECSENPFLEVESDDDSSSNQKTAETDQSTVADNSASNEIDNALSDGTALTDDPTANTDYDNRFETDLTDFRTPTTSTVQNDDYDFISTSVENNPISLQEHVYRQIDMKFKDANERVVAHKGLNFLLNGLLTIISLSLKVKSIFS